MNNKNFIPVNNLENLSHFGVINNKFVGIKYIYEHEDTFLYTGNNNKIVEIFVRIFEDDICKTLTYTENYNNLLPDEGNIFVINQWMNLIIINLEKGLWCYSSEYPYFISDIDGNYICHCDSGYIMFKERQFLYIFHSITYGYQTGMFIFDKNKNMFIDGCDNYKYYKEIKCNENDNKEIKCNENDNKESMLLSEETSEHNYPFWTNTFTEIHEKDIIGCCSYCEDIYLLISDEKEYVAKYDIDRNLLKKLIELDGIPLHIFANNEIVGVIFDNITDKYGSNVDKSIFAKIYDLDTLMLIKEFCVCENEGHYPLGIIFDNNILQVLSYKYYNPYGLIYDELRIKYPDLRIYSHMI